MNTQRRVLLADDHGLFIHLMAIGLRGMGYEVKCVPHSLRVLSVARAFQPDVIVLDLDMPELDGFALACQIRADDLLKDVRLIAATGAISPENVTLCTEVGFNVYLEKPFTHKELAELLSAQPEPSTETVAETFNLKLPEAGSGFVLH